MVTASVSLILVLAVIGLILTGRLPKLGAAVSMLCGASLAALLMPVVVMLGQAAQSAASMFETVAK